jgi:hypothetical protein
MTSTEADSIQKVRRFLMLVFDGMADSEQCASRYTGPSSLIPETTAQKKVEETYCIKDSSKKSSRTPKTPC